MKVIGLEQPHSKGLALLTEEFVVCCIAKHSPVLTCSSALTLNLLAGMHAAMFCVVTTCLAYASLTFAGSLAHVTLHMSPCAGNIRLISLMRQLKVLLRRKKLYFTNFGLFDVLVQAP